MADVTEGSKERVTIKKYANRRLYNTATSSYVTLDHLCRMVKEGTDFVVYDAKTGEDITHAVLTQIIVEEETKGPSLLPIGFLRQLIGFYGDNLQSFVPRYLEMSMAAFTRNQEDFRKVLQEAFGGFYPFGQFETMAKDNAAMFRNALGMFYPFARQAAGAADHEPGKEGGEVGALRAQFDALQKQIDALAKKSER
ncbi:MAG: polyhydroxyalkanoate synthesis repressor PhaR [Alphaproteobacteria bacterium]|nr:polyhydroxyalkanoate synthesis repressor PhaR [Alphaproteobacteria bacterium]